MGEPYLWRTANMSRRTCVVVKQIQSNPILSVACRTLISSLQTSCCGTTSRSSSDRVNACTSRRRVSQPLGVAAWASRSRDIRSSPSLQVSASSSHPLGASLGGADGTGATGATDVDGSVEAGPALSAEGTGRLPGDEGLPGAAFAVVLPAALDGERERDRAGAWLVEATGLAEGPATRRTTRVSWDDGERLRDLVRATPGGDNGMAGSWPLEAIGRSGCLSSPRLTRVSGGGGEGDREGRLDGLDRTLFHGRSSSEDEVSDRYAGTRRRLRRCTLPSSRLLLESAEASAVSSPGEDRAGKAFRVGVLVTELGLWAASPGPDWSSGKGGTGSAVWLGAPCAADGGSLPPGARGTTEWPALDFLASRRPYLAASSEPSSLMSAVAWVLPFSVGLV